MGPTDKPYCRGANAIFRKLPDDKAECVIDFRDPSLLPSVLFHLNGEYHDSQMHIRETVDLLREQLAAKDAEVKRLRGLLELVVLWRRARFAEVDEASKDSPSVIANFKSLERHFQNKLVPAIESELNTTALAAASRGEGQP